MTPNRIIRVLSTAAVAVTLAVAVPGAAHASAHAAAPPVPRAVVTTPASPASLAADVDDFTYASWDARYDLGLDAEGRAVLRATETLVARFPDFDQNRGIVRGLATTYEGAGLDTRVLSVTDESGDDLPYETDTDDGVLYILTGDDDYVQGLTTYVIEYEMRDVVLAADTGVDEFYWDLLPLDSTQDIESFRADIVVDEALVDDLTGAVDCYQGGSGSTDSCDIEGPADVGGAARFHVESGERSAGDGITVAIGFESGAVVQPASREPNALTDVAPIVAAGGAGLLSVASWFSVAAFKRRRRKATGVIVAQYDVPATMPPLLAGAIIPGAKTVIPAEIVHLAVNGILRIEDGAESEGPRLRRLASQPPEDELDAKALTSLFVGTASEGVVDIPAADEAFAARMGVLQEAGRKEAFSRDLVRRERSRAAMILQWIAIVAAVAGFGLALWGVISGRLGAIPALVIISFGAFLVLGSCFFAFAKHAVLTPDGALAYEYLQGVREFIRVAEADRLQMLQSYSGAERRHDGDVDVIHVYEKLLPYAMLFGMEDEWGQALETAYAAEQRGPSWIGDPRSPHLLAPLTAFAVSSHSASTYTAPSTASSSSFGGSGGGGFSGGGGGGGFSGGR